jgi:hypothetical protein
MQRSPSREHLSALGGSFESSQYSKERSFESAQYSTAAGSPRGSNDANGGKSNNAAGGGGSGGGGGGGGGGGSFTARRPSPLEIGRISNQSREGRISNHSPEGRISGGSQKSEHSAGSSEHIYRSLEEEKEQDDVVSGGGRGGGNGGRGGGGGGGGGGVSKEQEQRRVAPNIPAIQSSGRASGSNNTINTINTNSNNTTSNNTPGGSSASVGGVDDVSPIYFGNGNHRRRRISAGQETYFGKGNSSPRTSATADRRRRNTFGTHGGVVHFLFQRSKSDSERKRSGSDGNLPGLLSPRSNSSDARVSLDRQRTKSDGAQHADKSTPGGVVSHNVNHLRGSRTTSPRTSSRMSNSNSAADSRTAGGGVTSPLPRGDSDRSAEVTAQQSSGLSSPSAGAGVPPQQCFGSQSSKPKQGGFLREPATAGFLREPATAAAAAAVAVSERAVSLAAAAAAAAAAVRAADAPRSFSGTNNQMSSRFSSFASTSSSQHAPRSSPTAATNPMQPFSRLASRDTSASSSLSLSDNHGVFMHSTMPAIDGAERRSVDAAGAGGEGDSKAPASTSAIFHTLPEGILNAEDGTESPGLLLARREKTWLGAVQVEVS